MVSVWVCRAGKGGIYHKQFIKDEKVFLTWNGLDRDLSSFENETSLKSYIAIECNDSTATAISTHWNQVQIFTSKMRISDYVLTPSCSAGRYSIGVISSDYRYDHTVHPFHHYHMVNWIIHGVERNIFSIKMQHTLGAYRTVFSLKDDTEFLNYVSQVMTKGSELSGRK